MDKALNERGHKMSVVFYEVEGKRYYLFENWRKWQTINRPIPSKLPNPPFADGEGGGLRSHEVFNDKSMSIGMNGVASCYCYPIYKNASGNTVESVHGSIIVSVQKTGTQIKNLQIIMGENGRKFFELLNADTSYYYSIKLSIVPPFDDQNILYSIDTQRNNLIISANNKSVNESATKSAYAQFNNGNVICTQLTILHIVERTEEQIYGVFFGSSQTRTSLKSYEYHLAENDEIKQGDIVGVRQGPNPKFNPKLNGQNFKELVVTAASGDTFAYDIQKLNNGVITFEYSEPIQPEITKYYLRVQGDTGLYEKGTDENYTGLVGSTDNSIAYTNDQYANFISNNKNFYLQSNMKILSGVNQAVKSGIRSGASGGPMGMLAGAAQRLMSGVSGAITQAIERDMTIDNMKNAPDQLKNANGNPVFNLFATDLGLYVEKYSALEGDLLTANNFMDLYGFTFSSIAQVRDYVHIRTKHNYIKAQLQSIDGNLSNAAKNDLRQRFADGIRFWNTDIVNYVSENYEIDIGYKNFPLG